VSRYADFDLDAEEIVNAAIDILHESGLDAVSMRSVATRLGVSPVPLYSRVGNKDALVDAIADRLLLDLAPVTDGDESWDTYAARWALALRGRLHAARDSRLILSPARAAYVEASRPLIDAMRRDGFSADGAVQSCRLLMWATVGFVAVESGAEPAARPRRRSRPGADPGGVAPAEADTLFAMQIRHLIDGITADTATDMDMDMDMDTEADR